MNGYYDFLQKITRKHIQVWSKKNGLSRFFNHSPDAA